MASLFRSALVFAVASSLFVLAMPACSDQAEGERCDHFKDGDSTCDSGLICVPKSELLEEKTDLCCPPEGQESSSRCTRKGATGASGSNSGGTAGTGGTSGSAGEPSGGTSNVEGGTGGTGGDTGAAGEPAAGGTLGEGGTAGAGGSDSSAGAPVTLGGQAGSP